MSAKKEKEKKRMSAASRYTLSVCLPDPWNIVNQICIDPLRASLPRAPPSPDSDAFSGSPHADGQRQRRSRRIPLKTNETGNEKWYIFFVIKNYPSIIHHPPSATLLLIDWGTKYTTYVCR